MKYKKLSRKWSFLIVAIILLITLFIIPTSVVSASSTPSITTQLECYGGSGGGSWGTYLDIYLNQNNAVGPEPGWCADEYHEIYVGRWYGVMVYDYFGYDYAHNNYPLPPAVTKINWNAIAWILNNDTGYSMKVIQEAFWCVIYRPNDNNGAGLSVWLNDNSTSDVAAAENLADNAVSNHSNFVPLQGQYRPVICFSVGPSVVNQVQILFFQYGGGTPPPPLAEMSTGLLLGGGLIGLIGFVWYRKTHVNVPVKK